MSQTDVVSASNTTAVMLLPTLQDSQVLAPERRVDLAKFSPQQVQRLQQLSQTVSLRDTNTVLGFGAEPQKKLNDFLNQLLEGLQTNELGAAGALTMELATAVKVMNLPKMKREAEGGDWVANSVGRLPVVGKYASAIRHFQLSHRKVLDHFAAIETKAEKEMGTLRGTNSQLDRMVESAIEHIRDLELYLAAGQVALERMHSEYAANCRIALASKDPIQITRLRDAYEQINAFEARLVRMDLAFTRSMKSVPEIRTTQVAARIEICNVMDTVLFDLPELKRVIVQVGAVQRIAQANKANEARRELTRQLTGMGADALQNAYLASKRSQGDVGADVAALAAAADKLLQTVDMGMRIDAENRQKREAATAQLSEIRTKLLSGTQAQAEQLLALSSPVAQ